MTRDDIIRMAQQAGFFTEAGHCVTVTLEMAERFAALVAIHAAAKEREWMQDINKRLIAEAVAAERERAIVIAKDMKEELQAKFEQTYMEGVIAGAAAERKRLLDAAECCRMREHGGVCYEKAKGNEAD